jgi:hypothetical protein
MAKQAFKKFTLAVGAAATMIGQSLILTSITMNSNGENVPDMLGDNHENSQGLMGESALDNPFLQQELDQ